MVQAMRSRPDVIYAEPNYIRHKLTVPNDPRYPEQWALHNTAQDGGLAGNDIKAEQAWDKTTGSRNIVVGVVDEGIDISHPDLKDNIWTNPAEIPNNGVDDDGDAGRSAALRSVAESNSASTKLFNEAFVLMQYFGYLQRNPNDPPDTDYSGYNFWLAKLNQFNGDYIAAEMVKAFISSTEYRQRFGPS